MGGQITDRLEKFLRVLGCLVACVVERGVGGMKSYYVCLVTWCTHTKKWGCLISTAV